MFTANLSLEALKALTCGKDPVCSTEVEAAKAAGASTVGDRIYYFCSLACKQQFDADPSKYVGKA